MDGGLTSWKIAMRFGVDSRINGLIKLVASRFQKLHHGYISSTVSDGVSTMKRRGILKLMRKPKQMHHRESQQ
jgi:hypothetical protein